jgi:hypothetical protein
MESDPLTFLAISQLHARYADIATRQAWGDLGGLVLEDAPVSFDLGTGDVIEMTGADLVRFGPQATAAFSFYEYVPLNTVVTMTSDATATGRFYALEIGVERDSGDWVEFFGGYDDLYELRDGRWMYARRAFRTLARRIGGRTFVPGPR